MLILASQSPRRREILERAGLKAQIRIPQVSEERRPEETAGAFVRRMAVEKAHAVERATNEIVLAADTVVVIDDLVLGKPASPQDARDMLARLAGRDHCVATGVCLLHDAGEQVAASETRVWFGPLTGEEIEAYVVSGEPMDKAGAYAIQGLASKFIERVEGDYFNVVGLPVAMVYRLLKDIPEWRC